VLHYIRPKRLSCYKRAILWWSAISLKRQFIEATIHRSGNSSKRQFIKAAIHRSSNSLKWQFIEVAIHQTAFSSNAQAHLIFKTVSRIFILLGPFVSYKENEVL
jgi:hypothetical protein